ncbi:MULTISPECIES: aldolase/citrate lyase family protein [unclassified Leisingera]|uniref:aldolase/citrate lyase family protein n=1 Tax=unclassified Leisingera TaxID=2614906 RepID=UPI0002F98D40|nr:MULTISPECIES: HpcH/HpaI aldolase/citrate lyase family protein [unclassified Leisingera]KIC18622.1 2-keto-3-deoxy-L-rhamnonate aldolase [Leisingera sp. ANG-DT]KIC22742.1 2-keto-3-deoxy-L-rhamnonate aldolase [Leisingera sp. ANG-S3]KIC29034.1 2-keto-3-deoxy-L-rhamnonate aldolase [Leisingera sp. ANG-M6]KIC51614.1 2-keto-3-deoxy-L-rhamnonate aldolase [Leisingera sp. ANG-S]KID08800.1 2-keto-3-deoxy-L-rhamnonate aldolase [Leisingera sp. ANG1]
MPAPKNPFKQALTQGKRQIGCWMSFADGQLAEIMGTCGFDWLVIDGEHAPNDIRSIRDQLMALAASPSHPVVRVPVGETWMIKQVLDAGAQTVLVPIVESAEQARELVRACHYPPKGLRGVGATAARATMFGTVSEYIQTADQEVCLLVQVENRAGMAALDEILQVEGIDGVFIGPADLSTDMGHQGNSAHPEVRAAIADAITRIKAAGIAPGILGTTDEATQAYADMGAQFLAVGIDVMVLARNARDLAAKWKAD